MDGTTDDFLSYLKMVDFSTIAQTEFTDPELLTITDYTLINRLCPNLLRIEENYYLQKDIIPMVANQANYTLPKYAMFNMIHYVELVIGGLPYRLKRSVPERTYFQAQVPPGATGQPFWFYIEHNTLFFYPTPANSSYNYHIMYYRRPSQMVLKAAAAQILTVNKATGLVTYTAPPPVTFTASSVHDFYSSSSPFRRVATNITATAQAGATQTFAIADVQNLNVGDWGCLEGQTVFPDIPIELQDLLASLVVMRIAKIQNDTKKYQMSDKEVQDSIEQMYSVIRQRDIAQCVDINLLNSPFISPYMW